MCQTKAFGGTLLLTDVRTSDLVGHSGPGPLVTSRGGRSTLGRYCVRHSRVTKSSEMNTRERRKKHLQFVKRNKIYLT